MISSLVSGISLGLGAALPLGPINLLIMNQALKSYKGAVAIGLGAMSADIIYFLLTLSISIQIIKNPIALKILSIFGAFFLLYTAYQILKNKDIKIDKQAQEFTKKDMLKNYIKGLSITILNPYTIAFWLSVSATITSKNLEPIYTILGIVTAITLWITLMPLFIHKSKHLISTKLSSIFSTISAIIITYFAISLLIKIVTT